MFESSALRNFRQNLNLTKMLNPHFYQKDFERFEKYKCCNKSIQWSGGSNNKLLGEGSKYSCRNRQNFVSFLRHHFLSCAKGFRMPPFSWQKWHLQVQGGNVLFITLTATSIDKFCQWFLFFIRLLFPASIYLFKVNNRNTRKRCEICLKLTIKTPEQPH